jgi:hypothetical protein
MLPRILRAAVFGLSVAILPLASGMGPAAAQTGEAGRDSAAPGAVAPLIDALGMDRLLPVMREEGLVYAADLAEQMLPGRAGPSWENAVDRIYAVGKMRRIMARELAARLETDEIQVLTSFFTSDLGRRIVGLEVSAREAMLDPEVEAAAEATYAEMRRDGAPRLDLLEAFVEENELVEMNVVGALNSNWAFYQGLESGGAFDGRMSEDQMLADVWGQEEEIRDDTREWVYSYFALAYRPLSDDELRAYTELSATPEGEALNTALFAAFDVVFEQISRDLGRAVATAMSGEDI